MKLIVACCLLVFVAAEEKVAEQSVQPSQFGPAGPLSGLQGGQFAGQFGGYPQYQNQFRYQGYPYQQQYQFPFNPNYQLQFQQLPFDQYRYQQFPYQQFPYQQLPYQQFPYQQQQFSAAQLPGQFFPQGSFAYGGQSSGQFSGQPHGQALGFQAPSRNQYKK